MVTLINNYSPEVDIYFIKPPPNGLINNHNEQISSSKNIPISTRLTPWSITLEPYLMKILIKV